MAKETAEELLARINSKYGLGGNNSEVKTAPAPKVETPAPIPQPAQQPQGTIGRAMGILGGRKDQIDKAAGYKRGGIVRGKGTPTSDSVPVNVAGKNINVSDTEAILPGKTVAAMGGPAAVEKLIEKTNGKPPVKGGITAGGKYNVGVVGASEEEKRKAILESGNIGGQWFGGSSQPTIGATDQSAEYGKAIANSPSLVRSAFPNTMEAIQAGGDAAKAAADAGNYGAAIGQVGRGAVSGIAGLGKDVANSAAYMLDPAANALKTLVTGSNEPARPGGGVAQPQAAATQTAAATPAYAPPANRSGAANPNSVYGQGSVRTQNGTGSFAEDGKTYNVAGTSQDNIKRVTGGNLNSPLYTNVDPSQGIAGLKNQAIGQPADQEAQGLARIANANKIRGEMIANRDKDIPAGGYGPGILGDGGIEASNAEKTARWRQDDLIAHSNRGNQATIAAALNATARSGDVAGTNATHLQTAAMQSDAAKRGHEVNAQIAAGRDNTSMRNTDVNAANDKEKNGILAAQAKMPNYSNRYITLPNKKIYNELGQVTGEEQGGIFDAATGRPVQAQGASSPKQEYDAAIAAAKGDPAKIKAINDRARQNGVIQ